LRSFCAWRCSFRVYSGARSGSRLWMSLVDAPRRLRPVSPCRVVRLSIVVLGQLRSAAWWRSRSPRCRSRVRFDYIATSHAEYKTSFLATAAPDRQ
jgi:hypothetical protein